MKRVANLWPRVTAFDNLLRAWRNARRGKAGRSAVAAFALELEQNLLQLQRELVERSYRPGAYRQFEIYDRKPRLISAAPFRDRVVHHALMGVVEPLLDPRFIAESYACRRGRGVHAAVSRYQRWARRYAYALKLDIRAYFPSVDHLILKRKLRRRVRDDGVLWLFERIIDGSPPSPAAPGLFPGDDLVTLMQRRTGLPIGNLTSQFLGNLYLDDLDHFVKQQLRVKAYLRYVDDLVLLDDDKQRLWAACERIEARLAGDRLRLHPNKIRLCRTGDGVDVLGYRVYPHGIRLRNDNGYRYRRRLRQLAEAYRRGAIELADVSASVAAWVGHARHAHSEELRAAVLSSVSFTRGSLRTDAPSGGARRRLEQQRRQPAFRQPQQEHHR